MNWTVHLPWREILLTLILGIVLYMLWLVWKMRGLSRVKPQPPPAPAQTARDEPTLTNTAPAFPKSAAVGENNELPLVYPLPPLSPRHAERPSPLSRAHEGEIMHKTLMDGMSRELKELRQEVAILRDSFALLRDEMEMLRNSLQNTQVAQNASPLYKEAMQMAILGHDALTISERCGISRAEADLVVSLIKNGKPQ
ncbi:MAG: DUF2802 domain-containing protein [Betaproteobacteria bacterium]|nr:DUF2802 domain-containing protein [Betaproteobacteria bacterium]